MCPPKYFFLCLFSVLSSFSVLFTIFYVEKQQLVRFSLLPHHPHSSVDFVYRSQLQVAGSQKYKTKITITFSEKETKITPSSNRQYPSYYTLKCWNK